MARPQIGSWKEADDYINAGRNKNDRPLYSGWRIQRMADGTEDIGIFHKEDLSKALVIYHKDESVTLVWEDYSGKAHELLEGYNGQDMELNGYKYHLPSMGNNPDDWIECNNCKKSGKVDAVCQGPGMCMEVDLLPQYLVETGAPGAHCSHLETARHRMGFCEHQEQSNHPYKATCYWCDGAGQRNMGGAKKYEMWHHKSPKWPYDLVPMTIKDGKVISTNPADSFPKEEEEVQQNEESNSEVMAGSQ